MAKTMADKLYFCQTISPFLKHLSAGLGAAIWLDNSIAQPNILMIAGIIGVISYLVSGEMQSYNKGEYADYTGKGYVCAGSAFAVVYFISRDIRVSALSAVAAYVAGWAYHQAIQKGYCTKAYNPVV